VWEAGPTYYEGVTMSPIAKRVVNVADRFEIWDDGLCYLRAIAEPVAGGFVVKVLRIPVTLEPNDARELELWSAKVNERV
jgi:hypothetical protein